MKKNTPPQTAKAAGTPVAAALSKDVQRRIESGRMTAADIVECAEGFKERGDTEGCVAAYRLWLRGKSPSRHLALFNLGVTLSALGRSDEALEAYQQALVVQPLFPEALMNLGFLHERLGNPQQALALWRTLAESDQPALHQCAALNQIGRLSEILEIFDQAEDALARSLRMRPKQMDALQHWLRVRQKRCIWPTYGELPGNSKCDMLLATSPIAMLGESDVPIEQLYAARTLGLKLYPVQEPAMSEGRIYAHRRLRIGYLSSDFNIHAVGLLLAELFESHDLARFETFGFCVSKEDHTEHRQRLIASFEHFEIVGHLSDEQIARRILEHEIDVLVDLNGVSSNTRVGVLRFRPAPVQVTWLGYIGTTGLPWIDYVIADRIALPEKLADFFTEKPLYLPHCFLPFDSQRDVIETSPREAHHLPEGKFIFASFNNVTKLNPKMFATWMRILNRVPNSVLWLVDDNPWATANLRDFAQQHGIGPERLVFAERIPYGIHLARVAHTDLFLDNHPYNAGSTGNDTLHMGVPMLTLAGETFVSRMGYSLLHDFGLTELVTFNHQEYEDRAVELATHPTDLADIRRRLAASTARRERSKSIAFARNLEALFLEAAGKKPPSKVSSVLVRSLRNTPHPLSISNEFLMLALSEKREIQLHNEVLETPPHLEVEPTERPNFKKIPARILSLIPAGPLENPDVVLSAAVPPAPYAGAARKVLHFLSSDDFPLEAAADARVRAVNARFTEGVQHVVTPSAWSRERLIAAGMNPSRISVIPFGVDASVFQPLAPSGRAQIRAQMGVAQDDFLWIHVGGMSHDSGGDLLLRAFAELRRENPKLKLLLRDGVLEAGGSVQRMIDAVNLSHPGLISPEIIAGLVLLPKGMSLHHAQFFYSVSDLYVAPFRAEAFHLPALEAIACGVKTLVTEGGSADVLLTPGVCVPIKGAPVASGEGSPVASGAGTPVTKAAAIEPHYEDFVGQLRQFMKHPGAAQQINDSDRQKFVEKWSWAHVADQVVKMIQSE